MHHTEIIASHHALFQALGVDVWKYKFVPIARCSQLKASDRCTHVLKRPVQDLANPCHVKQLVTSPFCMLCYRGQGVGSAVVKHLLETPAAMTTDVFLVTLRRSIPFYKKAGFTLVPVRQVPRCGFLGSSLRSFPSSFHCLLVSLFLHSNWCPSRRLNYI